MGAPAAVASPGDPGREPGAPIWLTRHDRATGIRFHAGGTSRRVESCSHDRTRSTDASGGGAEEREPTGREAGLRLVRGPGAARPRRFPPPITAWQSERHPVPRARTAARVRSRCAVERRQRRHTGKGVAGVYHGTANEAPLALANGAEAEGSGEAGERSKARGSPATPPGSRRRQVQQRQHSNHHYLRPNHQHLPPHIPSRGRKTDGLDGKS